jgi:hypothetical protein
MGSFKITATLQKQRARGMKGAPSRAALGIFLVLGLREHLLLVLPLVRLALPEYVGSRLAGAMTERSRTDATTRCRHKDSPQVIPSTRELERLR